MVKIRRFLLMLSVTFSMILLIQYFKLSSGIFLSSLFSDGKSQAELEDNSQGWNSVIYPNSSIDSAYSGRLNSTIAYVTDGPPSVNEVYERGVSVKNVSNNFSPENIKNLGEGINDDIDPEEEFPSNGFSALNDSSTVHNIVRDNALETENTQEFELTSPNFSSINDSSVNHYIAASPVTLSPSNLRSDATILGNFGINVNNYITSPSPSTSSVEDAPNVTIEHGRPNSMEDPHSYPVIDPAIVKVSSPKDEFKRTSPAVVPISQMNHFLLQSRVSYRSIKPRWSSAVDKELLHIRFLVEHTPVTEIDPLIDISLYRNFSAFKRSYELMEQFLKVYIYKEGERPVFHQPPLKGLYASEGWFMKQLKSSKIFVTKNTQKAHLFYFPFSSRELEISLYVPNSHSHDNMVQYLSNYVNVIKKKYPFWNRTAGADHFLVACHDWAPAETLKVMANCIRALCNSDIKEGFRFGKDASLPETYVRTAQNPLRQLGGKPPSDRQILAFFAGNMHGYLRPILLNFWENKDPDMKIFGRLRKVKGEMSYAQYMKSSKYCICAKGYEVNSPRVIESIFYECVPVIISDNFVPPFFETLNWESFAVFVLEKDIPNLKNILLSISPKRFQLMHQRVKQVQQHFLWHSRPVKYDVFHMILHSIWHNRVFGT